MASEVQERADEAIRHQIELERYKSGQANKMTDMLADLNEDVVKRLDALNKKILEGQSKAFYTQKRLEKMSKNLNTLISKGYVDIHRTATLDNRELVENEIQWTAESLLSGIEEVTVPTTRQVFASIAENPFQGWLEQGKNTLTYVDSSPLRLVERQYTVDMERAMRSAYLSGSTIQEAEKLLVAINENIAKRNQDYNKARRNTEAETRTAIQTYANRAMQETLIENGIVWEAFLATLDSRTSEQCSNLDGTRWRIKDPRRPQVPVHWNCRSIYIPLFDKDERVPGTRPQVTPGQDYKKGSNKTSTGKVRKARRGNKELNRSRISTDTNFQDWLSRQDRTNPQFVRDYFGSEKKYQDWREGKLGRVKYTGVGGKQHSIEAYRLQTVSENLRGTVPPIELRKTKPAKYFIDKGGSKVVSKELKELLKAVEKGEPTPTQKKISEKIQDEVLNRRTKNRKRRSVAAATLKNVDILGEPFAEHLTTEEAIKMIKDAIALYGAKIKGIKKIKFNGIRLRSDLEKGILNINADGSNIYEEIGRFISRNDDAYLEATKYFATADLEQQFATYYSNMETGAKAFKQYKESKERFKFMMGVIDDKPKNVNVYTKTPRVVEQTTELPKTG